MLPAFRSGPETPGLGPTSLRRAQALPSATKAMCVVCFYRFL